MKLILLYFLTFASTLFTHFPIFVIFTSNKIVDSNWNVYGKIHDRKICELLKAFVLPADFKWNNFWNCILLITLCFSSCVDCQLRKIRMFPTINLIIFANVAKKIWEYEHWSNKNFCENIDFTHLLKMLFVIEEWKWSLNDIWHFDYLKV